MADQDPSCTAPSIDDLENINRFLALIGGQPIVEQPTALSTSASEETAIHSTTAATSVEEEQADFPVTSSNLTSGAASPHDGARAPPSTPATRPVHHTETYDIEALPASETAQALIKAAGQLKPGLLQSKYADKGYHVSDLGSHARSVLISKDPNQQSSRNIQKVSPPVIQQDFVNDTMGKCVSFQKSVLSDWKNEQPEEGTPEATTKANTLANSKITSSSSSDTEPFPPFEDIDPPISNMSQNDESLQQTSILQDTTNVDHQTSSSQAHLHKMFGDVLPVHIRQPKQPLPIAPYSAKDESPKKKVEGDVEEEDREHATYFKSWGSATARSTPAARIRKVILTNLPAAADNALVAGLIHGGAIESYQLSKPADNAVNKTATVIFTTADAADAYYDKYPNGVEFRFQGRKHYAFVDKGTQVDVISGVMRGYLESGASRVVRANGVEEDWSMMALRVLAEKKGRKVEAIVNSYREDVRTIVYHFTNIPDAVQFKGELIRNDDFEGCDIQFVEDPCVKKTGVHID